MKGTNGGKTDSRADSGNGMALQDTRIHTQQDAEHCISVHDDGTNRWLEFGDGGIQSIIDRHRPQHLVSPVSQAMLAALLFAPTPAQFLLLGTGGGAIARYLSHRLPGCRGDAVELSPVIADIARRFFEFPTHSWRLRQGDARDFVVNACTNQSTANNSNNPNHYDYIVLDIAEQQHTPYWLTEPPFLAHCRQRLFTTGVLCVNLIPNDAVDFMQQLARIRQAFDTRTLCLSVPEHRNILVFAFAQRPKIGDFAQIRQTAKLLIQQWELPFDAFLDRMIHENPTGSGVF